MRIRKKYVYMGIPILLMVGIGAYLLRDRIHAAFDDRTEHILATLEPRFRAKVRKLLAWARKNGIELRAISGHRDCNEQNRLYAQGRTAPGKIVTNARCGKSAHNYRVAVDVVEFREGRPLWNNPNWDLIGQMGTDLGLEWGGNWRSFKDRPHFQDLRGRTIAGLYNDYRNTGVLMV